MRFERRLGRATRIEVVTEGLLTRRLQRDPALEAYGLRDLRRVPRALARRRSRPRPVPGGAGGAAPGPAAAGHVGDPRRRGAGARIWATRRSCAATGRLFPVAGRASGAGPAEPLELRGRARRRAGAGAGRRRASWSSCPARARSAARQALLRLAGPASPVHAAPRRPAARGAGRRPSGPAAGARKVVLATNIAETSLTIEGDHRGGRRRPGAPAALLGPHRA